MIEFEIAEEQMPETPANIVRKLHPTGVIKEVKVGIHPERVQYAVETFIDSKQWDVEVTDSGRARCDGSSDIPQSYVKQFSFCSLIKSL